MSRLLWIVLTSCMLMACHQDEPAAPVTAPAESPPPTSTPDTAPVIGGVAAATVEAGQSYAFKPSAISNDGKPLAFSIANRPAWASFDAASGLLSGRPASGDVGDYPQVTISVATGSVSAALAPFSIRVLAPSPIPPTQPAPPAIGGNPPASVTVGTAYEFIPTASSPGGAPLAFSVTGKPTWASFDAATGALRGTPGAADVGHDAGIVIAVSDGTHATQLPAFSIDVVQIALGSVSLSWVAPTQNADGSALTNLAGFRIHYGTSAASMDTTIDVAGTSVLTHLVDNLQPATWYFAVSAYTATGAESDWSGIVSKRIP
jgi:hypothetical protein